MLLLRVEPLTTDWRRHLPEDHQRACRPPEAAAGGGSSL